MAEEMRADRPPGKNPWPHLGGTVLYSATATAPANLLGPAIGSEQALQAEFKKREIHFRRTIATDDRVVEALHEELCRRGLQGLGKCVGEKSTHVALVSEWDTLYGRALPEAVRQSLCRSAPCNLHEFSYLRGLEGVTSSAPLSQSRAKDAKDRGDAAARREDDLERAEGNAQLDYLRRLVQRIHDTDWALQRRRPPARIGAIGVLGSDAYDKLLVLQALRNDFPGVLFFTTDLDARFLYPSESRRTRNLIVASAFGLTLDGGLQGTLPPFRESYQTATFLATQLAVKSLDGSGREVQTSKSLDGWLARPPRLFEIGRTAALDLSERRLGPDCHVDDLLECKDVHPTPYSFLARVRGTALWAAPLVAAAGVVLLYGSSWRMRRVVGRAATGIRHGALETYAAVGAAGIGIVGLLALVLSAIVEEGGEPFALLEGVSVWPTQILRMAALVLNAVFLAVTLARLRGSTIELTSEFFPGCEGASATWRDLLTRHGRRRIFAGPSWANGGRGAASAAALWQEHLFQASPVARAARVVAMGGLFFAVGFLLIKFVFPEPLRFMRSEGLRHWDRGLITVSVALFLLLIFSIVDAIRLCDKFSRELGRRERTDWPRETRDKFRDRLSLQTAGEPALASWIDVQLIARWTEAIGPLVYYPFVTLGLLVVARSPVVANWDVPLGLYIVFGLSAAYMVVGAHTLRRLAERVRRVALEDLDQEIVRVSGKDSEAPLGRQLRLLRDAVAQMRAGAFAPFAQQPIVGAFLVPLLSGGGLAVLDYFLKA
jgi:hypothetical protein